MSFHWPYALFALPLALAGVLILFKTSARAREQLLGRFAAQRLLPLLLASHSPVLRRIKHGVLAAGVIFTVFALARPQWGYDWQEKQGRGVDVIFVLDTSKSMLTQDVQPNRLERAKLAILDTAEKMGGNRIGLVGFAGDAFLLCPLTLDYDAFRQTLETVDVNTIARGGTDIASGLDEAATALENSGNHKIIVLVTDGEDLAGEGVNEAKALAEQNVTVYTVGVGTAAGDLIPILDPKGGTDFVRDQRGEIVKSHLDADTLTSIANATHGFYQPLGPTGEGLAKVYDEGIKKIPQQDLASQMQRAPVERFQWPLGLGTLLLALEMLVGTRRPSWHKSSMATINLAEPLPVSAAKASTGNKTPSPKPSISAAATLLMFLLLARPSSHAADSPVDTQTAQSAQPATSADTTTPAQTTPPAESVQPAASVTASTGPTTPAQPSSAKEAQSLFQKGDYLGAAAAYGQAAEANPQDGRFRYNQGESLYRGKDYDAAADAFAKTLSSNDLQLQQQAYYNLGNSHYRLGQADVQQDQKKAQSSWEQAVKDYQNALELNTNDTDAKYNLGVVKAQLEELKKQMEQQKQQQDKKDQDKKDQDKQDNQQQNQSQQNQSQQNQDKQDQSQQNQPQNSQNQQQNKSNPQKSSSGNNQPSQQNSSNSPNQSQGQSGQQPSPDQSKQNNSQNPQDQKNQSGQKPSPGDQNKPANQSNRPGQKPGDQNKNGQQKQAGGNQTDKEPEQKNGGQNKAAGATGAGAAAAAATTDKGDQTADGTVVVGAMTREEARQLLDSLKTGERKLPVNQLQNQNAKPPPDQYQKDW